MDGPAPGPARPRRLSRAGAALLVALLALGLSLYGSLLSERHLAGSRLNEARNAPGAAFTRSSEGVRTAVAVGAYALPFVLGVVATVLGGWAMRGLERRPDERIGHLTAVLAVMIGGLAAVVSGCMLFAVYGWQHVPSYYTT
ncbi:MAG TPA: hypothetical protein VH092_00900 [Urbifossiella sp.]|jgi:hypothetical protein|nr:hypothetical protein [Urbifossiella sp.]